MDPETQALRRILNGTKSIAVVGLSADWNRPSYFAAKYMQSHGYRIIPVNPRYVDHAEGILGERCYARLSDIPCKVDMVDIFRRSEDVLPIAEEALAIDCQCLWQQLGVANEDANSLFIEANRESVMNRCVKIEHARLYGGLSWFGVNTGVISSKRSISRG